MLSKLRSSPRLQFLCLAVSTAAIASCTSLIAFLSDVTDPLEARFEMRTGTDFGVSIKTSTYEENALITPGESAAFDPYIVNDGDYSSYVFMKVTLPDETFHLQNLAASKWELVSQEDNQAIYAYSSNGKLTALPAATNKINTEKNTSITPSLCSSIALDDDTLLLDDTYQVTAIGYAIQANGLENKTPAQVWDEVKDT